MRKILGVALAAALLAACASQAGSIVGTIDSTKTISTPKYAVKGRTPYDQKWINVTTEALVDGFGQPRPKPRPASLDKPRPKAAPAAIKSAPSPKPDAAKPKRKWWQKADSLPDVQS